MAVRVFGTRIEAQGGDRYEREMRRAGQAGREAMDRVERGARPATRGMRLFSAASGQARESLQGLAGAAPGLGRIAAALGPAGIAVAALGVGGGLAFGAIANRARDAAEELAAIGDAADRAQIDVDLFEQLGAALTLEGQDAGGLERALSTFVRRLGEAEQGMQRSVKTFDQLGLEMDELRDLTPEDALLRVADGLAAIEDPAQRAAIAQRLFGEQGQALLLALDDGTEALKAQFQAAEDLGLLYGGDLIRSAQDLNIEFDQQAKIVGVALKSAFIEAGPAVSDLQQNFVEIIPVVLQFVSAVAAGVNEMLALLDLANRPANVQLGVNAAELDQIRQEQQRRLSSSGGGVRSRREGVGAQSPLGSIPQADLDRRERELLEQNGRLSAQIREQERLVDSLRNPPAINLPEIDPAGAASSGGGGRRGGAGGGGAQRDAFAEAVERTAQRIASLKLEAEAAGLAADQVARLKTAYDLSNAATADGTEISREEAAVIRETAGAHAAATAEKERATQASRDAAEAERDAARAADEFRQSLDDLASNAGDALGGLITGTKDWRDALGEVLDMVLRIAETQVRESGVLDRVGSGLFDGVGSSITSAIGSFASSIFGGLFADGAAFRDGRVVPFAGGGLVRSPTYFPMSGGRTGLMGESGPEAILPLVKTAGGGLGVQAEGGGGFTFVSNVDARGSTMGPEQFRVIAEAEASRAVRAYDSRLVGPSVRDAGRRLRI